MLPSIEIPKIGTLTDLQKARFEEAEDNLYSNIDADDRLSTVGIFGKQDELFNTGGQRILIEKTLSKICMYRFFDVYCIKRKITTQQQKL